MARRGPPSSNSTSTSTSTSPSRSSHAQNPNGKPPQPSHTKPTQSTILTDTDESSSAILLPPPPTTLYVCTSPGCLVDGARATLQALHALAPPHSTVQEGPCRSLCGSGPIVTQEWQDAAFSSGATGTPKSRNTNSNKSKSKTVRRVETPSQPAETTTTTPPLKGSKLWNLLVPDLEDPQQCTTNRKVLSNTEALWQGCQLGAVQGKQALEQHEYQEAIRLFEQAVAVAFRPAMDLQQAYEKQQQQQQQQISRSGSDPRAPPSKPPPSASSRRSSSLPSSRSSLSASNTPSTTTEAPSRLQWLIQVRRME